MIMSKGHECVIVNEACPKRNEEAGAFVAARRCLSTYAFIDAANVIYHNSDFNPWKIDLRKLIKYLNERFGVSKTFYYGGIDDRNKVQVRICQKMKSWGFILRLNPVKHFVNDRGEWYTKADVDSRMTFEMMHLLPEYDRAVVLTGDGDFFWVLDYLLQQKERVWLLASPKKTAKELKTLFGHRFTSLDDTRRWIEYIKREADPTNVSASGMTSSV